MKSKGTDMNDSSFGQHQCRFFSLFPGPPPTILANSLYSTKDLPSSKGGK